MRKNKQIDSFTFLRAVFIIAICIFHSSVRTLPGGFMAVISFFVLSGFLMMKKLDNIENFDLEVFFEIIKKRLIKLLPSLYFVLVISLLASLFLSKVVFHDSIKSSIPVALSYQNIYQIIKGGSYFTKNGYFSLFTHFWYISMQVQFILIFYLINYLINKINNKNVRIFIFTMLSTLSLILMISLSFDKNNISRIYYGIDTRINALFIGALAYLLIDNIYKIISFIKEKNIKEKYILYGLGFLTIIVYFFVQGESLYTYRIIMPLYTLIQALLIGLLFLYEKNNLIHINKKEMGIFKTLLYYIGLRSYYIYMWQYVVNTFISYFFASTTLPRLYAYLLEIVLVITLSEITYLIFNKKFDLKKYFLVTIILLIILNVVSIFLPNPKEKDMKNLEKRISENKENIEKNNKKYINKDKNKEKTNQKLPNKKISKKKAYDDFDFTNEEKEFLKNISITAVGDSVLINIDPFLREFSPNLYLDGEVGRQMTDGPGVLQAIKNSKGLGDIILISLGSNGSLTDQNMIDILNIADGRKVFFVNTVNSQSWEESINGKIKKFCDQNKNAYMVDWYKFAKGKTNLFAKDMVHPEIEGSKIYRNLIERAILNSYTK